MKHKLLSLALALALCLGLSVPALAAGEKKVVTDEKYGVTFTMDGFLREETHRYHDYNGFRQKFTLMVVADNSKVTIEAMEGRKYAKTEADENEFYEESGATSAFAYRGFMRSYEWSSEEKCFGGGVADSPYPLTGPYTETAAPAQRGEPVRISAGYSVYFICESDFAKLTPVDEPVLADAWAQGILENAYDAELFPNEFDPFVNDCTQGMTRAQFAETAVKLYAAVLGAPPYYDLSSSTPFTDTTNSFVGYAYNLGFVTGTSATTFSPDATLTREQAAVMLSKVYAKLRGDIPQAASTSFADDASVASWAKSAVAFMAEKGFVSGVGDNKFAPQKTLSIQEAVVIAQGMLEKLQ